MMKKDQDVAQSHDVAWMRKALFLAQKAYDRDEVPVGAILVRDGKVVAKAFNQKEELKSPLGHAEILCLHRASQRLHTWRLSDCTLYVTLEPCAMCAGAIVQARVGRLVFATLDPKAGAVRSLYELCEDKRLNHRLDVESGILAQDAANLLKKFFQQKRKQKAT